MRLVIITAALFMLGCAPRHIVHGTSGPFAGNERDVHAAWDGERFSCPAGMDMWASEQEALDGRDDYVYCVPRE